MNKRFYVDSSVYLNLWQKESSRVLKFGEIAKDFFDKAKESGAKIYYSGHLLKELQFVLKIQNYLEKMEMFEKTPNFGRIFLSREEAIEAEKIFRQRREDVGWYDVVHMVLSKKMKATLVTRDKALLKPCRRYDVQANLPEDVVFI